MLYSFFSPHLIHFCKCLPDMHLNNHSLSIIPSSKLCFMKKAANSVCNSNSTFSSRQPPYFGRQQKCFIPASYLPQLFSNLGFLEACPQALVLLVMTKNLYESMQHPFTSLIILHFYYLILQIDMHIRILNITLCNFHKIFCRIDSWIKTSVIRFVFKISMDIFFKSPLVYLSISSVWE